MNRKSLRACLLLLTILGVAYLLNIEFMPEMMAIGWHIRHGKTARLKSFGGKKYTIDVPAMWWANVDDGRWSVTLIKRTGRIGASLRQGEWATISFSVVPQYSTAEEIRQAAPILDRKGFTSIEVSTVRIAGQDLHCFEQDSKRLAELARNPLVVDLYCVPLADKHQFSADYFGSRAFVPEFYRVLYTVKRE